MYLHNLNTGKQKTFLYALAYDPETFSIRFLINPEVISQFKPMPQNLLLPMYLRKLGLQDFESSLEKNFGWDNCSVNRGIINELITIDFPISATYAQSSKRCSMCTNGIYFINDSPCYWCRGTGVKLIPATNLNAIGASLCTICRYLNNFVLTTDLWSARENGEDTQELILELNHPTGIGGEGGPVFFSELTKDTGSFTERARKNMMDLHFHIEGRKEFPNFPFSMRDHEFRCRIGPTGMFYLEVPGQNGCSIHMTHNSETEFMCHNIDTPHQQIPLIAGLASLSNAYVDHLLKTRA